LKRIKQQMTDTINVELIEVGIRCDDCHVCGSSDAVMGGIVAEVTSGPFKGFHVCPKCLKAPTRVHRLLEQQAAEYGDTAIAKTRAFSGRLRLPTYAQYEAKWAEYWAQHTDAPQPVTDRGTQDGLRLVATAADQVGPALKNIREALDAFAARSDVGARSRPAPARAKEQAT
jgi:hypothetical protein